MVFLILPTQLFEKKYLRGIDTVVLWECPWYFKQYKYNKKKILLHRASMRYYFDYLRSTMKVIYVGFEKTPKLDKYSMFDPIDDIKSVLPGTPTFVESPGFLLTKQTYEEYREKTVKFFFNPFYMFGKAKLGLIPDVKSTDAQNRSKLKEEAPSIPDLPETDKKYIRAARRILGKFADNPGDSRDFIFPVTHATAKKRLVDFIRNRFSKFGTYQDAISQDPFMFHSILSTSLNIGLLTPLDVVEAIKKAKGIPMNSYEGFIRQLFWREYQRYTYIYFYAANQNHNHFGGTKRLTAAWYDGTTGIDPLDFAIRTGFKYGYLHHIMRLMVVGNYMNLMGMHPKEGFRWFMEFACDSYEWVMCQNVLGMAFYADGGVTMRRPYISSSNYILRMSHFKKGAWSDKWDKLYRAFLKKHRGRLGYLFP